MKIDLTKFRLPPRYTRKGESCFFDPIREKLIPATPEEQVRQKIVSFLMDHCQVPQQMIHVEVPMCHFEKGAQGRADIVVYGIDDENDKVPAMVIECKAPDVILIDRHYDQVYAYDNVLNAETIALTNGRDFEIETYDWEKEAYQPLKQIPMYRDLLAQGNLVIDDSPPVEWKRPDFSRINTPEVIAEFKSYRNIGDDTDKRFYPFIINLAGFLYDRTWKMEPQVLNGIRIIEDGGERYTSFSNTGGAIAGYYRYFIIEDDKGNNQIISLGVAGLERLSSGHARCPNQRGNTHIVVAIDDFEKSQWLLQVCIDKHITVQGEKQYIIRHDCGLTCGTRCKNSEVRDFVRAHAPELLDDDGWVYLGTLDNTQEIRWQQPATREFIGRLIQYALLRDQFRNQKRGNNNGQEKNEPDQEAPGTSAAKRQNNS